MELWRVRDGALEAVTDTLADDAPEAPKPKAFVPRPEVKACRAMLSADSYFRYTWLHPNVGQAKKYREVAKECHSVMVVMK